MIIQTDCTPLSEWERLAKFYADYYIGGHHQSSEVLTEGENYAREECLAASLPE